MRHKLTLKANFNAGEGDIGNVLEFRYSNDPLMRADLLKDWIFLLEEEYEEALLDMRAEYKGWENVPSNV
jgi:hypothetical protein